jgi:hypothetical protein
VFPSSKETLLQMHQLQVITGILVLLLLPLLLHPPVAGTALLRR